LFDTVKRAFDLAFAVGLIALTSPIWILAGAAVAFTSGFPILYRAKRMGRDGAVFEMFKFRSMGQGAERAGPGITGAGDDRVTPVGRILRRWKLDELPQLINVVTGQMSMVGPRPEDPRYKDCYSPRQLAVLSVKPGITGPTQIRFRHEEGLLHGPDIDRRYREWLLPMKLDLDLAYVERRSMGADIALIVATIRSLLVREGMNDIEESVPSSTAHEIDRGIEENG
jgi:lipopolysaccharide/colanic/teichoic acid biosynthesis glycosyltransferase